MKKDSRYLFFYLFAVFLWGTDAAITKRFLLNTLAPLPMLAMRFAFAALFLTPFALHEFKTSSGLQRKDRLPLLSLVLIGTILTNSFYYLALARIPAFITLLLYRLEPVFLILLSAIFLHEKTSLRAWGLTIFALLCAAVIVLGNDSSAGLTSLDPWGILLILLAALFSATAMLQAKALLISYSPLLLSWMRSGLAAFLLILVNIGPLQRAVLAMSKADWLAVIALGAIYSGLAYWFYYKGLQASAALVGSLIQLLRPITGIGMSYLLLSEQPTAIQFLGSGGLILALYLLTRPEKDLQAKTVPAVRRPGI